MKRKKPYVNHWETMAGDQIKRDDGAKVLRATGFSVMQWIVFCPDGTVMRNKSKLIRRFHTCVGAMIAADKEFPL